MKSQVISRDNSILCLPVLLLSCWLGTSYAAMPLDCGEPKLDNADDSGLFLWKRYCGADVQSFVVRALGGNSSLPTRFHGRVASTEELTGVETSSLEKNDAVELLVGSLAIQFQLNVAKGGADTFYFQSHRAAKSCFGTDLPVGTQVRVGPEATLITAPFDLGTLESCSMALDQPPNIVVILTDDQRWDSLPSMPAVADLASRGLRFSSAFVSLPLCGPSRAAIHSGGFRASNNGVTSNNQTLSPIAEFNDRDTLATNLQSAGYQTFFTGKYLNGYRAGYVPPGWTRWIGNNTGPGTDWNNFEVTIGNSNANPTHGSIQAISQYVTDYHRDQINAFIDTAGSGPFFVFWAAFAPHHLATPAPEDETLFSDYLYRDRAWGETDLSDKPSWILGKYRFSASKRPDDEFHRQQLRSLQAVDRGVASIVEKVSALGLADRTVFFFLGDNGYHWGEHGLSGKGLAYEESLRVPLVAFGSGIVPGVENRLVFADLDLGPTITQLAGLPSRETDGQSLRPFLQGENPQWRSSMLFESWGPRGKGPYETWAALRTDRWKYIRPATGVEELYDLINDPYEEQSLHKSAEFDVVRRALSRQLEAEKSPALKTYTVPIGKVGTAYSAALRGWGGSGVYRWFVERGALPTGLFMDSSTGLISGTPTTVGSWTVRIRVDDGTIGTHSGRPRGQRSVYRFQVK